MIAWLSGTLVATALLMALVLAIRVPVARAFGARVAYALWLIPAARLFMPTITETVETPIREAAPVRLSAETLAMIADAQADAAAIDWIGLLLTVWIGGAALLFLGRMASYVSERDDVLTEARPLDTIDGIRIVESPAIAGPIAFGLFDRVVALPRGFRTNFNERERELALAHELAHHRAGDLWANLAAFGLLCLHWFNPLAWIAWRAFRFDQEAACDARVLANTESDDRPVYGRAIAKAASGRPLIFASALDNKKLLKQRLRTMKWNDKSKLRKSAGLALVLAGTAAALPLTATVTHAYVQAPEAPQPPAAPEAPDAPTMIAYQTVDADAGVTAEGDYEVNLDFEDENGERRIHMVRHGPNHEFDREALRRSLEEIPSREELRRIIEASVPSEAEIRAMIPAIDVEERCDGSAEPVRTETRNEGGREFTRLTICTDGIEQLALNSARDGLRTARSAVAADPDISAEDRRDALRELDREIDRLEREAR